MTALLYLDDIAPGQVFERGSVTIQTPDIQAFAEKFDPQAFHLNEDAARGSIFGGLAASGWQTASITQRLLVEGAAPFAGGVIGAGVELNWPKPTRPGDTLSVRSKIVDITPSRSKPDRGVVRMKVETRNQNGDIVLSMVGKMLVFRRPGQT
jgi:acyl dehydratase